MSEPRPKSLTEEMKLVVANKVALDLVRDGHIESADVDACTRDIARYARVSMDGYELAVELDQSAGWDCTLGIAETLDSFPSYARQALHDVQKDWAERNQIKPPLAVGTCIRLRSDETGTITEIYTHGPAQFLVSIDGDTRSGPPCNSRRIVNFEDANPVEKDG